MFTAVPNLQACANSWAVNLDANDTWSYWSVTYVISFTHLSPFQKKKRRTLLWRYSGWNKGVGGEVLCNQADDQATNAAHGSADKGLVAENINLSLKTNLEPRGTWCFPIGSMLRQKNINTKVWVGDESSRKKMALIQPPATGGWMTSHPCGLEGSTMDLGLVPIFHKPHTF